MAYERAQGGHASKRANSVGVRNSQGGRRDGRPASLRGFQSEPMLTFEHLARGAEIALRSDSDLISSELK